MDARLRELERAWRAAEGDASTGWAYARALERAGDRRTRFLVLAALARAGDAEAARAIDTFAPLEGPHALGRSRHAIRGEARIRDAVVPFTALHAASETVLFGGDFDGSVAAVDAVTLERRWGEPAPGRPFQARAFTLRGDDLLLGNDEGLTLRDARTGAVLGSAPVGLVASLALVGDRAVVLVVRPEAERVLVLDAGERFGRVLHELDRPFLHEVHASAACYLAAHSRHLGGLSLEHNVECFGLEDGLSRWHRPAEAWHVRALDARGVVQRIRGAGSERVEHDRVRELDPRDGSLRWERDLAPGVERRIREDQIVEWPGRAREDACVLLAGDVVVLSRTVYPSSGRFVAEVVALRRSDGGVAWTRALGRFPLGALAVGGELVYALLGPSLVAALRLADGEVVFEREIPGAESALPRRLVPLPGALVVFFATHEGGRVVRLEET